MQISVIICSHNPREDYLRRALDALQVQSLPRNEWELLVIDNASQNALAGAWDLSWHPHARHIRENELGLTPARLRGIKESQGELLVFVDDDNVLSPTYLVEARRIVEDMPQIKVFGGSIAGEFETPPEPWMEPYLAMLAIRKLDRDYWSNDPICLGYYPWGAGLCVCREVALAYARHFSDDSRRRHLDRCGSSLNSGGDDDLCFTAGHLGHGVGLFAKLSLVHLIPKRRVTEEYLLRLFEGMHYSGYILAFLWERPIHAPVRSLQWKLRNWNVRREMSSRDRRFAHAKLQAENRARKTIRELEGRSKQGQRAAFSPASVAVSQS